MPPATRRFSLLVLPPRVDDPAALVEAGAAALVEAGLLTAAGGPGHAALVEGGFGALRVVVDDGVRLLSNGQGGMRVACPRTGESVVPGFNRAITAWRSGGPRALACRCGAVHDLADLGYAPPAGFARAHLRVVDPAVAWLTPAGERALAAVWGAPPRIVGRRG